MADAEQMTDKELQTLADLTAKQMRIEAEAQAKVRAVRVEALASVNKALGGADGFAAIMAALRAVDRVAVDAETGQRIDRLVTVLGIDGAALVEAAG